ncbi:geranylgeranyl reductase family protein [Thermoanaerobacterium thermosaccharolyticum]|jgi:geranylgeranyl reductase family protein|uniref:geranylgeranyl reductase family protein n=1 Tax=Thermoanaerobacterium thermosaccharolyticum TaxID=1517 RepID=UPI00123C3265|nr:NAD(P)/FAD-dependent oxidoreductase [Thermoanaerobacterium thermosaccharolyticum]KAA5808390.1 NAD(P)/FAD-dependent oxidoreductase [Thermoanaerobacterium thermosaccharolyticum]
MYDVIIVGGGPAGSTLARKLSVQGLKVLLIEKHTIPRYKACGGGITPRCYKLLDLDISEYIEDITYKIDFKFPNDKTTVLETEKPIIYQVDRTKFDKYLIDKANESGCEIHDGETVFDFYNNDKEVVVMTDKGEYETRILVGADGINSTVAYKANLLNGKKGIALESEIYVDNSDIERLNGEVVVDFNAIKYGYGWVFPKKDRLSIGVGTFLNKASEIKKSLSKMIDENVVGDIEERKIYGHQLSFPDGRNGTFNTDKIMLIGDATRLADPFTGEGIYNALLTANISFDVIKKHFNGKCELDEYTFRLNREVVPDVGWAYRLAQFTYNNMDFIEKSVKFFPNVLAYFIDIMMGDNNYINYKLKVPLYALHIIRSKTKMKVESDMKRS